ncbi:MAG: HPr family phosphocarrier protein [Bacillota bacterium]|nr:HPr family phosphocarrier protein [Bacillota bacterium]
MEKTFILKNEKGMHIRPAGVFVKAAAAFKSNIEIKYKNKIVNGKSVMILMSLGAKKSDEITLIANGEDETEAMETLGKLIEDGFGEA